MLNYVYVAVGSAIGGVARFVVGSWMQRLVGLALYCVLVAVLRPRGLTASWSYLRALR